LCRDWNLDHLSLSTFFLDISKFFWIWIFLFLMLWFWYTQQLPLKFRKNTAVSTLYLSSLCLGYGVAFRGPTASHAVWTWKGYIYLIELLRQGFLVSAWIYEAGNGLSARVLRLLDHDALLLDFQRLCLPPCICK